MNPSPAEHPAHRLWCEPERGIVARIAEALESRGVHAARCVVLVPFAQLMGVARTMWTHCGRTGFAPRFETTRNWARGAGGFAPASHDIAFDMARDLVTAQGLLAQAGFAVERQALAGRLVELAYQIAPMAAAQTPDARGEWALPIYAALRVDGDVEWFRTEGALNAVALAWATNSAYATDVLMGEAVAAQADLLIVLDGLQPDPLTLKLCALWEARDAVVHLPLSVDGAGSFVPVATLHKATDPEDEAELATACVLRRIAEGHAPVALVATDRALTRRISAQLAAHGVVTHDETGWKLSTTRAAATVMGALRACGHEATSDQVLEWLKGLARDGADVVDVLEARLRREGLREWRRWCRYIARSARPEDETVMAFTASVEAWRSSLSKARALDAWLHDLRALLESTGVWKALSADRAGMRVISALWLDANADVDADAESASAGDAPVFGEAKVTLGDFTAWVRDVLEAGSFVVADNARAPRVVVLPIQQLLGRAFGAVVMPGCDDKRLPASPEPPGAWTRAQREALGLPLREALELAQRQAWALALGQPNCELSWREADAAGEPVRASPLLQALRLEGGAVPGTEPRTIEQVALRPTAHPMPSGDLLPLRDISTSVYEDLRRCPYRFFALRQLGLRDADEIESEIDKRDFGNWLHAVLGHFHDALRIEPTDEPARRLSLIDAAAERATREYALGDAEFLPFAAAWPAVRDGYLDWLAGHEATGATFVESEPWKRQPLGALNLVGRLDRVDRTPDGRVFVIDYKTESLATTKERVKDPTEDTQLAFYAALIADDTLRAAYVNVGEKSSGTSTVEQTEVVAARDVLVAGLMDDFARISAGAALPALGEGTVCEHCAARGLCRKDFWSDVGHDGAAPAAVPMAFAHAPVEPAGDPGALRVADAPAYEHNRAPVSRQAFYRIACDPRRSVAVEACAGAGKTWMLVSRIVRALLDDGDNACEPHEILAITFTKKAAGEMGERLDQWLADFAGRAPEVLVGELVVRGLDPVAAASAAPRLQGLYRRLLDGGRPVQFRTFHAWFAGLLRNAPIAALRSLGLPASYELLEDDSEARLHAWRPFFEAVSADDDALEDYRALVATHGRSQTAKALGEALTRRVEFTLSDPALHVQPFGAMFPALDGLRSPVDALGAESVRAQWLARASALGRESNKTPQKAAEAVIDVFGRGVPAMDERAAALARLRKAFFVATEDRLTQHLKKYEAAQEAEADLQLLCAAQAQHAAWLYQQRMTRLTRLLIDAFAGVKRAHGWIDMNDIEQAAQLLLSQSALSGWVQERLDARVAHLLIDEFQDTNPLQWQALHGWLSGYVGAGAKAPSVFIVGDPKQSIYRFRRAEPQVFIAARRFIREGLGGEFLTCDHTHRNARNVVGLVNEAMGEAQAQGRFDGFRDHSTERSDDGAVQKLPPIPRDAVERLAAAQGEPGVEGGLHWRDSLATPRVLPETRLLQLECEQAARWVEARIADGTPPRQIMVLARRRSRLSALQDALRDRRIAAQQPEKNDLNDAPEVLDVVALLDALVSPGHDLSLARALKSPLFGIGDAALVQLALAKRANPVASWFALLQDAGQTHPGLADLSESVARTLLRWQGWLAALPPHDALDAIYHDGDVLARFGAAAPPALRDTVLANLRGLLSASLEIDGARFTTAYGFVRALRAGGVRAPTVAAPDAVRLLTVHGAKGLEADNVLLLDSDAAAPRSQTMGVLVDWKGDEERPRRFVFVASEKSPPGCAAALLAEEQAARLREELNGLYVATTRARERLVLSAVQPARPNEGSWWTQLAARCEAVDVEPPLVDVDGLSAARSNGHFGLLRAPAVVPDADVEAVQVEPGTGPAVDAGASAFGQAMHRLLEWAVPGVSLNASQIRAAAREFAIDLSTARRAARSAERIRIGDGAWAWDADALDWQGNEVTLVHDGQVLRIDRLVRQRASGAWWVLDYKSEARPERDASLVAQLQRYRAAVQTACPGEVVHVAFLTGPGELVVIE
jgi:ATP-dependent helicase/nuclease subunit A